MKRFLDFYSSKHGAKNLIKVIIDSEDAESQERDHSEWGQCPPCLQVTLTEAELDVISSSDNVSIGRRMADKVKEMRKILQVDADNSLFHHRQNTKPVIGIFSREEESQYSWLMGALRSHPNKDHIAEVRPCGISNNGLQQFYQDLSHCKFGILYHSKNRGRINVTDVESALYDEELKDLSSKHGKNNVIVVIDDLEDSSDQERERILRHQPSIGTMAADLFLISLEEKKSNYQKYLLVNGEEAEKKLQNLTEVIRKIISGEKAGRLSSPGAREKSETKEQKKSKSRENETQTALADSQNTEKSRDGENKRGTELVLQGEKAGRLMSSPEAREKSETKEQKKSKSRENETQTALADAQNTEKSRDGENKRGTELVLQGEKAGGLMSPPGEREKSETKEQKKSKSRENESQTALGEGERRSGPVPAGSENPGTQPKEKRSIASMWKKLSPFHVDVPRLNALNKKSIGIFSRSLESEYSWLKMLLESQDFSNCVQSVRSCPVSNVFSKFEDEVTHCKFGILYHSKNRGRINVTDVTDSLYDEELEFLSSRLGKKNVVVVIDDLEDASEAMKNKLLRAQHSIEKLARDLILVERSSSEEKRRATREALEKVFQ